MSAGCWLAGKIQLVQLKYHLLCSAVSRSPLARSYIFNLQPPPLETSERKTPKLQRKSPKERPDSFAPEFWRFSGFQAKIYRICISRRPLKVSNPAYNATIIN